jgi:probable addiction module antidote protein
MAREITPRDAACTPRSEEDIAAYLDAVLEDGGSELLKAALAGIAWDSKLGRASLYKLPSPRGTPRLVTVARVLRAHGLPLSVSSH